MIAADISRWLNANGSFVDGMALCQEVNPAAWQQLRHYLRAPIIDAEVKKRLREALQGHSLSVSTPALSFVPVGSAPPLPATRASEPQEVRQLRQQAKLLHKQQAERHAQLRLMAEQTDKYTDEDRYLLARELMEDIIPALDDIYDRIRAWEKDAVLPPSGSAQVIAQTVAKMQKLDSLKPRISRVKSWLKAGEKLVQNKKISLSAADREALEAELVEKQAEVERLEIELGIDGGN